MKKVISVICIVLLLAVLLTACSQNASKSTPDEKAQTDVVQVKCVTVETPYATLQVPEEFDKDVKSSVSQEDPYILDFSTVDDNTKIFSLHFNDKTNNLLGTLPLESENIVIYADIPEIDEKSENYQRDVGYQMQLSVIIDKLIEDYDFVPNEIIEAEDNEVFAIETDLTTLYYPKKWENKVTVTAGEDKVSFSAGETPLFDLYFKEVEGTQLGTYKNTPIYIVEHKVKDDEHAAMIHDVNVIIQHLSEDKNFAMK